VFLDTSGLFAAAQSRSRPHEPARDALDRLLHSTTRLATSDLVIAEFHGLTLGRLGPSVALTATRRLIESPRIEIVPTGPLWLEAALEFITVRPARRISMADAVSMLLMRARGIDTAFTLDDDFRAEGFTLLP
jgi:predicted nucleic acid-binding protein